MIYILLPRDGTCVKPIVRKIYYRFAPPPRAQLVNVVCERLALALDIVEDPDFAADPLRNPDRHGVGLGAGAPDVEDGLDGQQRIGADAALADSAFHSGLRQLAREIGAFERFRVAAFPNVIVAVR